jgi:hypothetical protein
MKKALLPLAIAGSLLLAWHVPANANVATRQTCKVHCGNGAYGGETGGTLQSCAEIYTSLCGDSGGNLTFGGTYIAIPAPAGPPAPPAGL